MKTLLLFLASMSIALAQPIDLGSGVRILSPAEPIGNPSLTISCQANKGARTTTTYKGNGDVEIQFQGGGTVLINGTTGHVSWTGKTPDKASRDFWDALQENRKIALKCWGKP